MNKLFSYVFEELPNKESSRESRFVYHVGGNLYEDIRALDYQKGIKRREYVGTKEYLDKYFREVNSFPGAVSIKDVKLLRSRKFKRWDVEKLYLYKIDLLDVENRINSINVTSTPEQAEFDSDNWDSFYKVNKDVDDATWFERKKVYLENRTDYLKSKGIKDNMSVREYMDLVETKDWGNMNKYFHINSKKGNKNQYASYIPHVQLDCNGPLDFVSVVEIN